MGVLVLTVNQHSRVKIGNDIFISVPGKTRLCIEAPSGVNIGREKTPEKDEKDYYGNNKASSSKKKKIITAELR